MIKIFIMFAIVFAICYFGIDAYRKLTGKEKLALTKVVAYSILCSVVSVSVLAAIVILF
jgi:hypothetical protein